MDHDGNVNINRVPEYLNPAAWETYKPTMKFCYQCFLRGTEFVGPKASKDREWIRRLYNALIRDWKTDATGFVEEI